MSRPSPGENHVMVHTTIRIMMIAVRKASLPAYLRASQFAQSWSDSDEQVHIDSILLKMDESVNEQPQLAHLLNTLQFWIVDELPMTIVDFIAKGNFDETSLLLQPYESTLPFVSSLLKIFSADLEYRWAAALRCDCLVCVKYFLECNLHPRWDYSCSTAAEAGSIKCLQYLHSRGWPWNAGTCLLAAKNGHLECLKYLHQQYCPWDEGTTFASATAGCTNCLAYPICIGYALENNCPCDYRAAKSAARNGHVGTLKLIRQGVSLTYLEWKLVTAASSEYGQVECLRYLHEEGGVIDMLALLAAARGGQLESMKYLYEFGYSWDSFVAHMAASRGHLNCLQFAIEHGCTWDSSALDKAATDQVKEYLIGLNGLNFVDNVS